MFEWQVASSHVGPLDADNGAGKSLQLPAGQILHVPLPQVTQVWNGIAEDQSTSGKENANELKALRGDTNSPSCRHTRS